MSDPIQKIHNPHDPTINQGIMTRKSGRRLLLMLMLMLLGKECLQHIV